MVKNFLKVGIFMVSLAMLPMGMTSCSDDDDDETTSSSSSSDDSSSTEEEEEEEEEEATVDLSAVVDTYINTVVYPTYTNLANATVELYEGLTDLQTKLSDGTITQDDIDAVCETFLEARAWWELSEAWLYGPADQFGIDPHIDTWPLDRAELAQILADDDMRSNLEGDIDSAINYISVENGEVSHLGFHGVEFIIFRNGEPRTVEALQGYEDDSAFTANTVTGAYELSFARAVAGDLRNWTSYLEVAWMGTDADADHQTYAATAANSVGQDLIIEAVGEYYGVDMLNAGSGSTYYEYVKEAIVAILVDGCSNICNEVADQKMGQPYRAATGTATEDEMSDEEYVGIEYIESPYSHKSFTDFYDNITSIKNALYGNIGGDSYDEESSIMAYLALNNADMATEMQSLLDAALEALDTCVNYQYAFVTIINNGDSTGMSYVYAAMSAISTLDDYLNEAADWISKN